MHQIAGDHRAFAVREDIDAAMTGRVPRRRRQRNGVIQRVVVIDKERLASLHDGQAIVTKHGAGRIGALFMLSFPHGIFALVKNVFCVREGRHPAPVF